MSFSVNQVSKTFGGFLFRDCIVMVPGFLQES